MEDSFVSDLLSMSTSVTWVTEFRDVVACITDNRIVRSNKIVEDFRTLIAMMEGTRKLEEENNCSQMFHQGMLVTGESSLANLKYK